MADPFLWNSKRCRDCTDLADTVWLIDSKEYFSWERYFTALLIEKAAGTYLNYTKKTLNKAYLSDSTKNAILGQMMKGKPE